MDNFSTTKALDHVRRLLDDPSWGLDKSCSESLTLYAIDVGMSCSWVLAQSQALHELTWWVLGAVWVAWNGFGCRLAIVELSTDSQVDFLADARCRKKTGGGSPSSKFLRIETVGIF